MPTERSSRLLIVEDDRATRRLLQIILAEAYEVDMASTVEEALRKAAATRYDAFVLDINLREDLTGRDLLHRLRSQPGYEAVPAIAVTAYAKRGDRESFLADGFDAYVRKPFYRAGLLETMQSVLAS